MLFYKQPPRSGRNERRVGREAMKEITNDGALSIPSALISRKDNGAVTRERMEKDGVAK